MIRTIATLLCLACATPGFAQESRYVTFKTVNDQWGKTEHQVDRGTIKQDGAYKIFWTRIWKPADRQPVAISAGGRLFVWSQKFAVDCAGRRFTSRAIESTDTMEKTARLQTVRWTALDKNPAIGRAVCGAK